MTAKVIPFVPRNSTDRRPMHEQHDVQAAGPKAGGIDDLTWPGMDVLYETTLGFAPFVAPETDPA